MTGPHGPAAGPGDPATTGAGADTHGPAGHPSGDAGDGCRHLSVCALYPELMNMYADRGNLIVLQDRCRWRGIDVDVTCAGPGEEVDPGAHDIFYLGGGQDREQRLCAEDLATVKREGLQDAARRGAVVLGICGGFQLLGHGYRTGAERLPGLGLLDVETVREPGPRLTGNVAVSTGLGRPGQVLAGFENHGGRTYLGDARPLGRVLRGHGNNGRDGTEGAVGGPRDNVIGTYLHGPVLSSNAWLADWIIAAALGESPGELPSLDDRIEDAGHRSACRAAGLS